MILPRLTLERITFFETHNGPWAEHAAEIGTSTAEIAALAAKTAAARAAFDAQQRALSEARAATQAYHHAAAAMSEAGADVLLKIKAKAAAEGEAGGGVYELALIPHPAAPSPVGRPGTPTNFTATLDPTGPLTIAWACRNPRGAVGTVYQVSRQLGGFDQPVHVLGATGEKKFTDESIPPGTACVVYRVVALRSTGTGSPGLFAVRFGGGAMGGGTMTASPAFQPKRAA